MSHPAERELGIMMPVQIYPMFETALRAAAGRTVEDHRPASASCGPTSVTWRPATRTHGSASRSRRRRSRPSAR